MKSSPPLFARIMLGISALVLVGVAYWFLSQALESTPIPSVSPPRHAQSFNPKADVSKNPIFPLLTTQLNSQLPDLPTGRQNPFLPVATSTVGQTIPPEGGQVAGTSLKIVPVPTTTESSAGTTPHEGAATSSGMIELPLVPQAMTTSAL